MSPSPEAALTAIREAHPQWLRPIPEFRDRSNWRDVPLHPLQPAKDPSVAIGPFAPAPYDRLLANPLYAAPFDDSPYAPDGMPGYPHAIFLRRSVANALVRVQEAVEPFGLRLLIYDGLRDASAQRALYEPFRAEVARLAATLGLPLTAEQITAYTLLFVAAPSTDPQAPAPHQVGAVDVSLVWLPGSSAARLTEIDGAIHAAGADREALELDRLRAWKDSVQPLPYGAPFDHGGPAAAARHLEGADSPADSVARDSRRLLFSLMTGEAGMAPVVAEYWHFDPAASQMGVQVLGSGTAVMGAMQLTDDDRAHAERVRQWYLSVAQTDGGRSTSLPAAECILPTAEGVLGYARSVGVVADDSR